ncbi:MAG: FixH family protein [Thermomonas sp.]
MVWLIIALPLAAVISSIWLVVLSYRGGSIDAVADDVQRTGQIQTTDLDPDARASQRKLSAVLQSENGVLRVFPATGEFRRDQPLHVQLLHPNLEKADKVLTLAPDDLGWHVAYAADMTHDWSIVLSNDVGDNKAKTGEPWRLRGRLARGQHAAHLGPALDAQ